MSKLLVNIRGTNGSGKSTIPMSMLDDPKMYVVKKEYKGKDRGVCTVFPTYGWVALGTYTTKCGGMDTFPDTEFTKKAVRWVLKNLPEYNVMMEGILCSTVFSTYKELFEACQRRFGVKAIVLYLMPPLQVCLDRIQKRNGGKPIKTEQVEGKYRGMERCIKKWYDTDVECIVKDNSKISKEHMLAKFLKLMERYENG